MRYKFFLLFSILLVNTSSMYADQDWLTYRKSIIDTLTAIEFDGDTIWLGTNNGIGVYDTVTGKTKEFQWDNTPASLIVYDIAVDHESVGWIATNNGIWRVGNSTLTLSEETDNQYILAAEVDNNNIKWFITNDAVLRFDGSEWQVFTGENGLPAGSLTTLAIDDTNTLWIGTQKKGIISFDGTEWTLYDLYKPDVVTIAVDSEKRLWFGDFHGMVYSYDGNEWSSIQVVSKQWFLYSIDVDRYGILWAASNKGLYRVENGESTIYTEEDGLESTFSKIVKVDDRDGSTVWAVGSGIRALAKYDGTAFKRADFTLTGPVENKVFSIAIDQNNLKCFGHKTQGISRYDGALWSEIRYKNIDMLGEHMAVDANNSKWFSAEPGIVLMYDDNNFTTYSIQGLNSDGEPRCPLYAHDIVADNNGVIYILATAYNNYIMYGYIYRKKGEIIIHYVNVAVIYVTSLGIDSRNYVWWPSYLGYLTGKKYEHEIETINGPANLYITNIYFDRTDTLWVFSIIGLASFDGELWTEYTTENSGLTSNLVNVVYADRNNILWIGTDAGVSRFEDETWTTFNTENSGLCDNKVNAIAVEKNNTIWFGTDNGVSKYTGEVITTSVDEEDKIPEALPIIHSHPNPFNPSTNIEFTLPESGFTTLSIYNISGQKVRELAADYMTAGAHSLTWDGKDGSGKAVSSGVYITRLQAGKHVAVGRMVLMR